MIRAGRRVVDTAGYAKLFGVPLAQCRDAINNGPEPVSSNKKRRRLWDEEQAASNAAGDPESEWSALPTEDSPDDLLDDQEARELVGMSQPNWVHAATLPVYPRPQPDVVVCDIPHYYRRTLENWRANRPGRGAGAGRKPGSSPGRYATGAYAQYAGAVAAMLQAAEREGTTLSAKQVQRELKLPDTPAGERAAQRLVADVRRERQEG